MKKNLLFVIPMIVVAVLLFMLRATGMTAHIVVSVVGVLLLVAYTHVSKKTWKCPSVEIIQRMLRRGINYRYCNYECTWH